MRKAIKEERLKIEDEVKSSCLSSLISNLQPRGFLALLLLTVATFALGQTVELEREVFEISRQLRCPVCTAESVGDSSSPVAIEMRNIVQERLEAGQSEAEILGYFQSRYGDWILLEPPKRGLHLLVWLLPIVGGVIGVATLLLLFRQWTRRSQQPVEVDEADLVRVREAMGRDG